MECIETVKKKGMKSSEITGAIGRYKNASLFYFWSTLVPWLFWFAAGYVSRITPYDDRYLRWASALAFAGLLAPVAVAFALVRRDPALRRDVRGRFFNFRDVPPRYFLAACLIMPASIMAAQAISLLWGYDASQFIITGQFTFSSGIFPVWFLLIVAPIVEELAWHTYGTDSLRARFNLLRSSLLFGVYWGIWHVPLSTIREYYQSNVAESGWIYGLNFLVSIVPYVVLMNWLYYKTGRNIVVAAVFHITAGLFNELFAPHPDSKIIQTVLLCLLAVGVVAGNKKLFTVR